MKQLVLLTVACLLVLPGLASADHGHLSGRFVYSGDVPTPKPIAITKDQAVCGNNGLVDESLAVNPDNKGIANVVVYVYVGRGKEAPTPHESYAASADEKVVLDNVNCRYEPHFVLLRTGQTLQVGNKDAVGHNTKIDTIKNPPANPIIPANGQAEFQFKKEERLPVTVSCSIHPWMTARLLIKDTPYMAVTDKDGKFKIENLPEGEWTFQVWHEGGGYVDSVKIGGNKTRWTKGRFEQAIAAGDNDLGDIMVEPATLK